MIPQSDSGGSSFKHFLPRLNSSGKLAGSFGGGINELALLDGAGKIPVGASQVGTVFGRSGTITATSGDYTAAQVTGAQDVAQKAQANGYASLDGAGKVPAGQLPDAIVGALKYKGARDATAAAPSAPAQGDYYVISVAGSVSLSGIVDWKIGDWAVYNGAQWEKIDNTDSVTTIFGRAGTVTAQSGDYTVGQVTGAQDVAQKDQNSGYAGIGANGLVTKPVRAVATTVPSTTSGEIGVDQNKLKFGEGANVRIVVDGSDKDVNNGVAGLDGNGKVNREPASKGAANGMASLDGTSRLPAGQLTAGVTKADGSVSFTAVQAMAGTRLKIQPTKTADYLLTANDDGVPFDAAGAARVASLPLATGSGQRYLISKEDSSVNAVVITPDLNGAGADDLINGAASLSLLVRYETVTVVDFLPGHWRTF